MVEEKARDPQFAPRIVTITSVSAVMSSANRAEYCISKSGLSMMSRLFAHRLAAYGIPVDSSAAVVAAQGLVRLGTYLARKGESAPAARYLQAGLTVAQTLFREALRCHAGNRRCGVTTTRWNWRCFWCDWETTPLT